MLDFLNAQQDRNGMMGDTAAVPDEQPSISVYDRLIRSAAYAAGCPTALFAQPGLSMAAFRCFGAQAPFSPELEQLLVATALVIPSDGVLVINDVEVGRTEPAIVALARALMPAGGPSVRFIAAVQVRRPGGQRCGTLVLADTARHVGLSAAQTYVLSTHAAQLGACLELQELQGATRHGPSTERLRLLESVVVNANDAVLITEAEPVGLPGPRIVYCNAAFTRATGYTEAEILGLTPRILQSPHVDRTKLDRLRRSLERWEPVEVELLNVKKDGTEFWVELSIVPVADERGWFTHWVSVQRDVSHRKHAEEIATRARIAEVENRALEAEIRERKRTEQRLLHAAFHDDLTQLHNRAHFMDRLAAALRQAAKHQGSVEAGQPEPCCSVLFLDLDRFKLVNDSLGHRAGDLLLMEVARRLQGCMRPQDTLARVGGDEFAVLLENSGEVVAAVVVAERIIGVLSQPIALGHDDVFSLCSVGIVQATGHYTKPEELLRDADIAMYEAKKRGGGNFAIFDETMHAGVVEALALQTDLRHAVAREEFHLHYQPIYDPATSRLTGMEALIRWSHPQRGLVPPGAFIPMAEEIGMIRDIGRWVLRQACGQMRAWQDQGMDRGVLLSVNVSSDELRDPVFVPELNAVLRSTGFDARRLQLEITESMFLRQPEVIGQLLKRIRTLGIRIALDDFGTGYSSLGYLDRYEIDTLKIDRSFVARMLGQRRAMAILESIMQLGTALEVDIVAEGVETQAQFEKLRDMRCGHIQGYLLSRPLSVEDMTARLGRGPESPIPRYPAA